VIAIAVPAIGDEEIAAVNAVLASGMLAQGPKVAELEERFAAYCGTTYAVAVNSGTAAIHAALHAAGVGPGDEVITTPFSFIATINPILMCGARPVLVDIDPRTYTLDPTAITQAITKKTKAIMPVHLYGQACDWQPIADIASQHSLKLIEDACQAVGAEYDGIKTGALGDLGCFSLYATKNIMSAEGGIVTTNDAGYADTIKRFRQHGMVGPYEYEGLGYNYRMTDILAAIGNEQLKKADNFNTARQANAAKLSAGLQAIAGLTLPYQAPGRTHVFHQFTIKIDKAEFGMGRDELAQRLRDQGVGVGVFYPKPLHAYKHIQALGYKLGDFPEAEAAAASVLSLPVHPGLSHDDVMAVIAAVKGARSV